jgi:hypothetical protein
MTRPPELQGTSRQATHEHWLARVRGEYLEMPGLSLTQIQAQRLWGLDPHACETVLVALLQAGFLRRTSQGGYVRADAA